MDGPTAVILAACCLALGLLIAFLWRQQEGRSIHSPAVTLPVLIVAIMVAVLSMFSGPRSTAASHFAAAIMLFGIAADSNFCRALVEQVWGVEARFIGRIQRCEPYAFSVRELRTATMLIRLVGFIFAGVGFLIGFWCLPVKSN
ncbi:hypothetical protein Pan44_47250 [Caulifigura coniformis]|uniref:Uncharacterized protein n=1 Tax=Caulifigura coniformis TaxID=2527983 RepID=A0A517SKM6_9PLAN|nr:hypothetical protein [Caulifigura coniformis]QDT56668.1 hypothetical protein Pan44_47250 [Caulifigura coniformis]